MKIESALYKPFGEQSEWLLPGNTAPETKGWIGERFDADAGLQYLNARYYDPELSLFLQPDWFEVTKPGVGTNRFSYSFNDPVNGIDPGGNETLQGVAKEGVTDEGQQTKEVTVESPPFDDILVLTSVDGVLVPTVLPPEAYGDTTFRVRPTGDGSGQIIGVPNAGGTTLGYKGKYAGSVGLSRVIDEASPGSSMVEVSDDGKTLELTTIHGSAVGSTEVEVNISNGEVSVTFTADDPIETNVSKTTFENTRNGYRVTASEPVSLTQKAVDWMKDMILKQIR